MVFHAQKRQKKRIIEQLDIDVDVQVQVLEQRLREMQTLIEQHQTRFLATQKKFLDCVLEMQRKLHSARKAPQELKRERQRSAAQLAHAKRNFQAQVTQLEDALREREAAHALEIAALQAAHEEQIRALQAQQQ